MTTTPDHNGQPVLSIFGSYAPKPGEPLWELAYQIGHALARAGFVVCNGGYDGTMEASAKGAKDAGGTTIGVTCAVFSDYRGVPLKANPYIDREILHHNVFTRIDEMMHLARGYVILEGGTGTLSELGMIWEHVCKGLIAPRPIFIVGDFWRPLVDRLIAARPKSGKHVHCLAAPDEIARVAMSCLTPGAPPAVKES